MLLKKIPEFIMIKKTNIVPITVKKEKLYETKTLKKVWQFIIIFGFLIFKYN
jgi:hypothetical protein